MEYLISYSCGSAYAKIRRLESTAVNNMSKTFLIVTSNFGSYITGSFACYGHSNTFIHATGQVEGNRPKQLVDSSSTRSRWLYLILNNERVQVLRTFST